MNGTINKVILMGRIGDAIKLTYFSEGNCVGRFVLATDQVYINPQSKERTIITDWHTIVVRNKIAEIFEKYLNKGDMVYLEGRLKNRQWQAQDGATRYTTEIYVTDFRFLNNKKNPQEQEIQQEIISDINTDDYPF